MQDDIPFNELCDIYHEVLELPEDQRQSYIDENVTSRELKKQLYEILAVQEQADDYFNNLFEEAVGPSVEEPVPERIGPYNIIAPIGRGGMSTVYKAVHESGGRHRYYALKVLRKGLDTEDILRRFHQERQLLSGIKHPAIAGLLDAGSTNDGRPWIVLEYIDGVSITEYCRIHNIDISQRLKLFLEVCRIVRYAHQNLVIHRDIKPANIMVTNEGEVRLLDFGIAKIIQPDSPDYTISDIRAMTPEYASPEQSKGETLTTSSDQYSLGLLLYKLLTGVRADTSGNTSANEATENREVPTLPSAVCLRDEKSMIFSQEEIGTSHESLSKELKGDLDKITLKCLQPDPEQRYSSLGDLIRDIDNYLQGQPVSARTPSFSYRAGKFLKRNKIPLSVASGFIVTLITFAVFAIFYAIERDRFAEEVKQEKEHAEAISGFMTSVFEYADPFAGEETVTTAEEMLQYAENEVVENYDDRSPRLTATFLKTLSSIYTNLGKFEKAAEIGQTNLDFIENNEINDNNLIYQAKLNSSHAYIKDGDLDRAGEIIDGVESALATETVDNDELLVQLNYQKAEIASSHHEFNTSLEYLNTAVEIAENTDQELNIYNVYNLLGTVHMGLDKEGRAQQYYEKALERARIEYGYNHPNTASVYERLASLYSTNGTYEQAEEVAKRALEIREKQLGRNHNAVASSYNNLGRIYRQMSRYEEAKEALETSLEIRRELYGQYNFRLAPALSSIGVIYRRLEDYDSALDAYYRALDIKEFNYGRNHPQLTVTLTNIGFLYRVLEQYERAEEYYSRSLDIRRETYGEQHSQTASIYEHMAGLKEDQKKYEEAGRYYEHLVEIYRDHMQDYDEAISGINSLLYNYRFAGRSDKLVEHNEANYEIFKEELGPRHEHTTYLNYIRGNLYSYLGDHEKALQLHYQQLSDFESDEWEPSVLRRAQNLYGITRAEVNRGNYEHAREFALRAYDLLMNERDRRTNLVVWVSYFLGTIEMETGNYQQALAHFTEGEEILDEFISSFFPELEAMLFRNTGKTYQLMGMPSEAIAYLNQAADLIDNHGDQITRIEPSDVYDYLAEAFEMSNEPAKAEQYSRKSSVN